MGNKWSAWRYCARAAVILGLLGPMGIRVNINLHLLPATSTVYLIVGPLGDVPIKMYVCSVACYFSTMDFSSFFFLIGGCDQILNQQWLDKRSFNFLLTVLNSLFFCVLPLL